MRIFTHVCAGREKRVMRYNRKAMLQGEKVDSPKTTWPLPLSGAHTIEMVYAAEEEHVHSKLLRLVPHGTSTSLLARIPLSRPLTLSGHFCLALMPVLSRSRRPVCDCSTAGLWLEARADHGCTQAPHRAQGTAPPSSPLIVSPWSPIAASPHVTSHHTPSLPLTASPSSPRSSETKPKSTLKSICVFYMEQACILYHVTEDLTDFDIDFHSCSAGYVGKYMP